MRMRMYDIIDKKKRGQVLSAQEIQFAINGYVAEKIPDYQMSALLMAIYFQGMNDEELLAMTDCMAKSGDEIDLSAIQGIKVDKHSTGGVGDKTTLVVAPLVAACGGRVAKMSGRGLGFTGGTIDKLESIPGYQTDVAQERFFEIVNTVGASIIGQSAQIATADKKMYALRDVTATVDSIPLIAASIMSKKLASGSDKIVLDVTVGSGAFMKSTEEAVRLAQKMVSIGEGAGKETVALLTNMDVPLGIAVGNDIEVQEAIDTLNGNGPEDFRKICIEFASYMLYLAGIAPLQECRKKVVHAIEDGSAVRKLGQMVEAQGGDSTYIEYPEKFIQAPFTLEYKMETDGYIQHMDTELCGKTAVVLGAGRETKESQIDPKAGIRFLHKTGEYVKAGETLAVLYTSKEVCLEDSLEMLKKVYTFGEEKAEKIPSVLAIVTKDGVERMDQK